jgi:hypothetical protein
MMMKKIEPQPAIKKREEIKREYEVSREGFKMLCRTTNNSIKELVVFYNTQTHDLPTNPTFLQHLVEASGQILSALQADQPTHELPDLESITRKRIERD